MADSQDATLLQRRARRRLVGAIALVVLVVIVLPIVLEKERKPFEQDLVIQIPSQNAAGKFNAGVLPPPNVAHAGANAPAAKNEVPAVAPEAKSVKPETKAAAQVPPKEQTAAAKPASSTPKAASAGQAPAQGNDEHAPAAKPAESGRWAVQTGAFAEAKNAKKLQAKLRAAGLKSYVETVKAKSGTQTRVRLGPFDTKAEAERAGEKAKAMGLRADLVPAAGAPGR